MITDNQTNCLYLADTLLKKYATFYKRFEKVVTDCNIAFDFLPNTKDVWTVDYMPIQTDLTRFIRFLYRPAYITKYKKYINTISDVDSICNDIHISTIKTNILLDGGNVVKTNKKVIMTDRVFAENPNYERKKLIKELYELLQVEKIYFVPEQPGDYTGHADGMVRFINEDTIVVNDYKKEKPSFYKAFEIAIHNTGLECIKIPYSIYNNKTDSQANGDYINYLQMENIIIIPTFGITEDEEVIKQFETIFSNHNIATVDSNEIANDGGILNCITWNIRVDKV